MRARALPRGGTSSETFILLHIGNNNADSYGVTTLSPFFERPEELPVNLSRIRRRLHQTHQHHYYPLAAVSANAVFLSTYRSDEETQSIEEEPF